MIYFSVLFNYCFFPSLHLFCSFLFLLFACARQTRYQELAVALDSSNLTNKQLVTKIEELVRNNPTNQFDIVFAAPPRSLGVCKVTGSLAVPQGRLLTQRFVWNKMGWMGNLWEDQSLRPLGVWWLIWGSRNRVKLFLFKCALLIFSHCPWMISILIKELFLVLVWILEIQSSGAGSSVKTCSCRWWCCSKYISRIGAIGPREPGAVFWSYPQLLLAQWMNCFVLWPAWIPAAAFQPSALTLQEMQLSGSVPGWKEPFLCEILSPILFSLKLHFSQSSAFPSVPHDPSFCFIFGFGLILFCSFSFLCFSWAAEVQCIAHPGFSLFASFSVCLELCRAFAAFVLLPLLFPLMLCAGIAKIKTSPFHLQSCFKIHWGSSSNKEASWPIFIIWEEEKILIM